jgi:hypothetical protein
MDRHLRDSAAKIFCLPFFVYSMWCCGLGIWLEMAEEWGQRNES